MRLIETDVDLESYLIQFVKEYTTKMNELEKRICELEENEEDGDTDFFEEYKNGYTPIFQQYVTSKKRVYGGQGNSYGIPTKYDGIEKETVGQVTFLSKIKVEVYFKTSNTFAAEYLFILLKEGGKWKIDSAKNKWYNNKEWNKLIM